MVFLFTLHAGQNPKHNKLLGGLSGSQMRLWLPLKIHWGPSILADSGRLCILLFDNASHWPVSADFGAHWVFKGMPKSKFFNEININDGEVATRNVARTKIKF